MSHLREIYHASSEYRKLNRPEHIPASCEALISGTKMTIRNRDQHAEISGRLFKPEVLNDMRVIQLLENSTLLPQRFHDCHLAAVVPVLLGSWEFNLFDGNHFTGGSI